MKVVDGLAADGDGTTIREKHAKMAGTCVIADGEFQIGHLGESGSYFLHDDRTLVF